MSHHTVNYKAMIHQQGYRLTPQRELVLDLVCEHGPHCTSEKIVALVQQQDPSVARSTAYRALDFLCEVGLLASSHLQDTRVYEVAVGGRAHHHLVCRVCERDMEVDPALFTALFNQIDAQHGFAVEAEHLVLSGLCADCRRNQ